MGTYQKIFKRVEEKYMLDRDTYIVFLNKIKDKIEENEYPHSRILNLYYDTPNWDYAIRSIQKPSFKEKIRARSYKVPNEDDTVFLESKKKAFGILSKRRIGMKLSELESYHETGMLKTPENKQIFSEIDNVVKKHNLAPRMMIAYDRDSYYLKEDKDFRITFDFNLRSREQDLDLSLGDAGKKFFKDDICILELKTDKAIPLWLVKIMNELDMYPVSFSKYGEIYKNKIKCNM